MTSSSRTDQNARQIRTPEPPAITSDGATPPHVTHAADPFPCQPCQPTRPRALLVQMACARGDARGSVGIQMLAAHYSAVASAACGSAAPPIGASSSYEGRSSRRSSRPLRGSSCRSFSRECPRRRSRCERSPRRSRSCECPRRRSTRAPSCRSSNRSSRSSRGRSSRCERSSRRSRADARWCLCRCSRPDEPERCEDA